MVIIRSIQPEHYADYVALIGSQLGEGYLTENHFVELAADPLAVCFEAQAINGDVLGVVTAKILERQNAFELLKIRPEQVPDYAKQCEKIGIFKTIAISETAKGQGIGTQLVRALMQTFQQKNLHVVACVAWQYGETENIKGIMQRFSFERVAEIPDYWIDDPEPFICPACGKPPCRCQANIYFKAI